MPWHWLPRFSNRGEVLQDRSGSPCPDCYLLKSPAAQFHSTIFQWQRQFHSCPWLPLPTSAGIYWRAVALPLRGGLLTGGSGQSPRPCFASPPPPPIPP